MKAALFLHAHQPPTQYPEITAKIANNSYQAILDVLRKSHASITINFTASLGIQLQELQFDSLIQGFSNLASEGQVEFSSTGAFHPLFTKLPASEIIRQLELNDRINTGVFGDAFKTKGVFPPEMVFNETVGEVLSNTEYKWLLLDESAFPGAGLVTSDLHHSLKIGSYHYRFQDTNLHIVFRDRPLSLQVAFHQITTKDQFIEVLQKHQEQAGEAYSVIALDAETFGHHNHQNISFLQEILSATEIEWLTISDILALPIETVSIDPLYSTWGVASESLDGERVFPRWYNRENPIHALQWGLFQLTVAVGEHSSDVVDDFDRALHSDQFWWASKMPCWHLDMIRRGTALMVSAVEKSSKANQAQRQYAQELADAIVTKGEELYGSEIIDC